MKRTPEPAELMDEAQQAQAYAGADFSEANELFLDLFGQLRPGPFAGRAIDLGCGPADIPLRFARRHPDATIDAVDGAPAMLALAEAAIDAEGLGQRIRLHCRHLPADAWPESRYQAVLSNSLLHHLADSMDLWHTVKQCAAPGAAVLVMDLLRPDSPQAVEALVETYAADAPAVLQRDFRASLHAAYTPGEVRAQLDEAGLSRLEVRRVSDRHLAAMGILP